MQTVIAIMRLMRLNSSFCTLLFMLPCLYGSFWGMYNYADWLESVKLSLWLMLCSFIMRSAGCVLNDIIDADIDRLVKRTKSRPIAAREISVLFALLIFFILCIFGLCILLILSTMALYISFVGAALIVLYPFSKRIIKRPQFVLGAAANIGVLVGYAQITKTLNISSILLYTAGIYWTMIYDTIYAYQDVVDDLKIGVNSTAALYGDSGKSKLRAFVAIMTICLIFAGILHPFHISFLFYIIIAFMPISLLYTINALQLKNSSSCNMCFKKCIISGFIVLLAILMAKL